MKNALFLSFLMLGLFVSPAISSDFDCNFPPFGASIESLNGNGDFVKYMEKEGISYYNYTNQCVLPIHERVSPAVSYGFVKGKLYAKYISYMAGPEFKNGVFKKFLIGKYGEHIKDKVVKKIEGDWDVYKVEFPEKKVLIKYKFNRVTRQIKSNWYYQPLRLERTRQQG